MTDATATSKSDAQRHVARPHRPSLKDVDYRHIILVKDHSCVQQCEAQLGHTMSDDQSERLAGRLLAIFILERSLHVGRE